MSVKNNEDFVYDIVENSVILYELQMINNVEFTMLYLTEMMNDKIYYISNLKALVVLEYKGENFIIYDIFSKNEVNIHSVIKVLSSDNVKKVTLGFTPNNNDIYECVHLFSTQGMLKP